MTLTDKIAALPPMPEPLFKPEPKRSGEFNMTEYWQMVAAGYAARNALLCDAIRGIAKDAAKRPMAHLVGWRALSEAEKVLAACEVRHD